MATQVEIARHLDLSERRVRDVMKELGIDLGVDLFFTLAQVAPF
ncbi:hypothetical protein CCP3SC15_1740004 [Gammaproteobacteria bacterium]